MLETPVKYIRARSKPNEILAKFKSIFGPIITLVYNLVIGGVIGVVIFPADYIQGFALIFLFFFTSYLK